MKARRMAIINSFSEIIMGKRKDAIEARAASGIEQDWIEDEEHYDGIDNANRTSGSTQKGRSPTDGLRESKKDTSTRSTIFLKITRPYVDAAAARVSDMLLPTDDRNFAIRSEPKPELTTISQAPQPKQGGIRGMIGKMFGQPQSQVDVVAVAKDSAEKAQTWIDDQLVQCRYHAEIRKMIESAAKVGTGIIKGPHPKLLRNRCAKQIGNSWAVEMVENIAPTSKYVNYWNFYPSSDCGDNVQNGSGVFECDDLTRSRLVDLKSDPSYISEMIDMCLEEGPTNISDGTRKLKEGQKPKETDLYQIWYFHGQVSKKDMEAAGCKCGEKETYPASVVMVNDRVIKVALSPLDSGEYPYDVMVWQSKVGRWAGVGVSRQMRECQKGANAAVRNLQDNAALSAGPQIVVNRNKIVPANGRWELTPRKIWYTKAEEDVDNVNHAFQIVTIETRQQELLNILQFWLKEAEDVTGLPMLLQGQQGNAPDTVGGMQIINNNGSTVLRRIARTFDDRVTEPHIGRYYEYLLMYGPDEAKGQFTIEARGSSALVERELQSRQLMQILGMAINPAYGLDPEEVATEFLKSMRFDTKSLKLSDEKKQEMAKRPAPEAPQITAAKIREAGAIQREQLKAKEAADHTAAEAHLAMNQQAFESSESDKDRQNKIALAMINEQMQSMELTSVERQVLDKIKAELAKTSMSLSLQKDLSLANHTVDLHKHFTPQVASPAMEPAGRAPAGEAFQA